MILPIYIEPQPVLRTPANPVTEVTPEILTLIQDMRESMHNADGLGLAAPQIGQSLALFIVEFLSKDPEEAIPFIAFINPEIIWRSTQKTVMEEACLSIPDKAGDVKRPSKVTVRYTDEAGIRRERTADGLLGRVIQHEFDHLRGVLFTDYIPADRQRARKAPAYPRL